MGDPNHMHKSVVINNKTEAKIPGNDTTRAVEEGVGRNNYEDVHAKMQK